MTKRGNNVRKVRPADVGGSSEPPGRLSLRAPAKLNLDLLVGPRRPDGFHDLDSLVVQIDLCDEIELAARGDGRIELECTGADCGPAEKNLAVRAAKLLAEAGKCKAGADIRLVKKIPPGMGLAGGSSDAAATLKGLNNLWNLGFNDGRLMELASRLGSDVPLFFRISSRMTGRGELLEDLAVGDFHAVLILPPFACPTAEVYRKFDELGLARPDWNRRQPEFADQIARSPVSCAVRLWNDLLAAAQDARPELREMRLKIQDALHRPILMTGSGSGLFVLCDGEPDASNLMGMMPEQYKPLCRIAKKL
ncbi:MAG: 4-(cytidine 5'-diphospho)-2-C-methyl-D-erythritol kinase [Planctomycetes bacterium]|nr:4-(cytidine 5'-diphospho)-2-C-methyl-D-erythritol kinase [Planctomycetota bacterium]